MKTMISGSQPGRGSNCLIEKFWLVEAFLLPLIALRVTWFPFYLIVWDCPDHTPGCIPERQVHRRLDIAPHTHQASVILLLFPL